MESHDLDVDNYDLEDLLELFKLDYNFSGDDLKKAKTICLKTHPDKSGLDKKYFIFYKKAFEVVAQIFYFRGQRKDRPMEYQVDYDESNKKLLDPLTKNGNFNNWFNQNFEKVKIKDEEHDEGYDDWFRSSEDQVKAKLIPFNKFNEEFYKRKRECSAIARQNTVQDMGASSGYNLVRDRIEYSSDIFSKLKFQDLKKAHTETLIPVTKDDFDRRPKFANVESFRRHRNSTKIKPVSMEESQRILLQKEDLDGKNNTRRAFKMYQQDLKVEKANNVWWKTIKQLADR